MPDLTEQQKRQKAEDLIHELNPDALFMDGFDDAIIGIGQKFTDDPVVVYDEDDIFKVLFKWGMNYEEAQEYFPTIEDYDNCVSQLDDLFEIRIYDLAIYNITNELLYKLKR